MNFELKLTIEVIIIIIHIKLRDTKQVKVSTVCADVSLDDVVVTADLTNPAAMDFATGIPLFAACVWINKWRMITIAVHV